MKTKNVLFSITALILMMVSFSYAYNVNNYFTNPGSGKENTLVISGTQTVSGYLNVTGTQAVSGTMSIADLTATGLITGSSCTITNTITGGTITDGTATLTAGTITGLLDMTSSSGTITNQLTAGTVDTGQGATEIYAMDQDIQTTDDPTFADLTVTYGVDVATIVATGQISSVGLVNTGTMKMSYVVASDSTTLTVSSATVVECSKDGIMSVDLPTAVGNTGLYFLIKKTGTAGAVTLVTNSTETIDGADDPTDIDAQYDFLGIVSNGTNWIIVNRYIQ
jgi:hypothetical protein